MHLSAAVLHFLIINVSQGMKNSQKYAVAGLIALLPAMIA